MKICQTTIKDDLVYQILKIGSFLSSISLFSFLVVVIAGALFPIVRHRRIPAIESMW
jgi:hypothetical protein